ncbi:MAG: DegT/DnrJ/EryC1/StrS family aminotransferase, partial [Hungateiclostridium thermocellum]|nr:DegT/DnrJ/EryC1/StrS family aminotransferase [Acetivibrio thermocellus]
MDRIIQVTRSELPDLNDYISEIKDLWDSHWLTNMGIKHQKLEVELMRFLDVSNISLFTNGHLALECAISAFQLTGEVITTPFTFASTTHAIVRNGLKPVFCDINPDDFTIDTEKLEALITEKTTAILPVHVYGNPCDTNAIKKIADKYKLKVIYDAAHAFGVSVNGISIAKFGDASMFSFHATKVYNTIEGGALTYNDPELKEVFYKMINFGLTGHESADYIGTNAKMNEFQAAMGLCNLRNITDKINKRKAVVERYMEHLSGIYGIKLPTYKSEVKSNYAYFPVVFDGYRATRDQIYEELKKHNIFARKYFYPLTSDFDCYR